jgi:hypothetical protein
MPLQDLWQHFSGGEEEEEEEEAPVQQDDAEQLQT